MTNNLNLEIKFTKFATDKKEVKKDRRTEYGEMLKEIVDTLNISRISNKYQPMSYGRVGKDLKKVGITEYRDIYYLLSICRDAGRRDKRYDAGFAKCYYGHIRKKELEMFEHNKKHLDENNR